MIYTGCAIVGCTPGKKRLMVICPCVICRCYQIKWIRRMSIDNERKCTIRLHNIINVISSIRNSNSCSSIYIRLRNCSLTMPGISLVVCLSNGSNRTSSRSIINCGCYCIIHTTAMFTGLKVNREIDCPVRSRIGRNI